MTAGELFQPITQVPTEVVAKAGTTLIDTGVLGAVLVLSLTVNIVVGWLFVRLSNKRVEDTIVITSLAKEMVNTFTQVNAAVAALNEASRTQTNALQGLSSSLNSFLMSTLARTGLLSSGHHPPGGPGLPPGNL